MAKLSKHLDMQNVSQDVDRISGLPDSLIHLIFSYLYTDDVVQTCLLSKRWRDIWCSVPFLNFDIKYYASGFEAEDHVVSKFSKFVEYVLVHRYGSNVQSFHLCTSLWIIYALRHNVEVLHIKLNSVDPPQAIAQRVFMSTSLKELRLDSSEESFEAGVFFNLEVPNSVCMPNLTLLFLRGLDLKHPGNLTQMLSSCLSLRTLIIINCIFLDDECLTISAAKLETFHLDCVNGCIYKIYAPSLVSLHMTVSELKLSIDDCPSLVDASIKYGTSSAKSMKELGRAFIKVVSLQISSFYSPPRTSDYALRTLDLVQTELKSLKFLNLGICSSWKHVRVVALLRFCPNIETLILEFEDYKECSAESTYEVWSEKALPHLKIAKLQNFRGLRHQVNFIELFFTRATNLETLIIMASKHIKDSEKKKLLAEITKILLEYPRATRFSTDASIGSVSCVLV